jgi:hypothetical protein
MTARWLQVFIAGSVLAAQALVAVPALAQTALPAIGIWQPGPDASGDDTYTGSIDLPSNGSSQPAMGSVQLSGWVVDTTAQGWSGIDDVQVWDQPMNLGGHLIAHSTIQTSRPDVAAALNNPAWTASGFDATVPPSTLAPGLATLYVYAHTPSKGWWYTQTDFFLSGSPFAFDPRLDLKTPTPLASLHANAPFTVSGTAIDRNASPSQGTGVDRVEVYLNGDRKTGIFLGDATLGIADPSTVSFGAQFVKGGWQLQFQPASAMPSVADNQMVPLTVYAHSAVTGTETSTATQILIELP